MAKGSGGAGKARSSGGDSERWARSTKKELATIAKEWGEKYSIARLRAFQSSYNEQLARSGLSDLQIRELTNRRKVVDAAIGYRAFTLNKG